MGGCTDCWFGRVYPFVYPMLLLHHDVSEEPNGPTSYLKLR
jgi:hypothetical protein